MLQAARLVRVGSALRACGSGSASLLVQHGFATDADGPRHQGGDPQHQAARRQEGGGGGGGGWVHGSRERPPRKQRPRSREFPLEDAEQVNKKIFPAYICNVNSSLLREDIASFFEGYNLPLEEIRPEYSWERFQIARFWLAFASAEDRQRALSRSGAYLGTRRVVMRTALPRDFTSAVFNPLAMSSRGRYLLVEGLPTTSTSEDVLRMFSGYDLQAKAVTFLREQEAGELVGAKRRPDGSSSRDKEKAEKAVVRFATRQEAHRALRDRQGSFCGSNSVRLCILQ